ncbi:MAG: hypothetical protein IJM25_05645 [Eubacterium sp.]|nr:hypothetical protein [Eubacterium sp.]
MPSINRIRVNNVKYNFGTQAYDDFSMRLYGQNTLYDLANGGGKSVLMLLLMQCMIPNCTLDDKQPLEKLFRENCGNTTIHSLIEWKLDPADVKDGMRFMTTGFCARKARDRGEEEGRDVASVEYFNYCIFYQEYNRHDIMNLPLSEGSERLTYQALKNYLHDLARRENRIEVRVFDRKGEYQRFISRYGIIESQWEIVRGINRTEGHVRTYFETNYRTTRKVVEDLLIEEIIEKAYLVKTEQDEAQDRSAAALLLSIREQLKELAEKKRDIANYDHEAELIRLLGDRIRSFSGLYEERDGLLRSIGDIYLTLDAARAGRERETERLQQAVEQAEQASDAARSEVEILKTSRQERELDALKEREKEAREEADRATEELRAKEEGLNRRRGELDYLDYIEENRKLQSLLEEARQEVPEDIAPVVAGIRVLLQEEETRAERQAEDIRRELGQIGKDAEKARKLAEDAKIELAVVQRELAGYEAEAYQVRRELAELQQAEETATLMPAELQLMEAEKALQSVRAERLAEEKKGPEREKALLQQRRELQEKEAALGLLRQRCEIYRAGEEERKAKRLRRDQIRKIYHAEDRDVRDVVFQKIKADVSRCTELERELLRLENRGREIRNGRLIQLSEDVEKVLSYITTRHGVTAMFGADYLAELPAEERGKLLQADPELPFGIITRDYERLAEDPGLTSMEVGQSAVRIYDMTELGEPFGASEHHFSVHCNKEFFLSEGTADRLLAAISAASENAGTELGYLTDAVRTERSDLEFLMGTESDQEIENPEELLSSAEEEMEQLRRKAEESEAEDAGIRERLASSEQEEARLAARVEQLKYRITLQRKAEELDACCGESRKQETRLSKAIGEHGREEEERQRLLEGLRESEQQIGVVIARTKMTWKEQYEAYWSPTARAASGTLEELTGQFRLWKQNMAGASETLAGRNLLQQTLTQSIARILREIRERKLSLEELEEAYQRGELRPGDRSRLDAEEEQIRMLREQRERRQAKLAEASAAVQHLSGSIEYAIQNIRAAYGAYETSRMTAEELDRAIPEAEERRTAAVKGLGEAREALRVFQRQSQESEGLYREAGRLSERYRIDLSRAAVREQPEDQLQREFEAVLVSLDRNEKSLERAKSQMLRTKGQVTETLMDLGAATLSVSIRDDADIPGTKDAADALAKRLTDMEELIRLERSRVEQGLSDMEKLKENFVEQCVERCLDVRTELDKLPRLSQIKVRNASYGQSAASGEPAGDAKDGQEEMIQMIRLSVPYVKDEFLRQRMSEYIDRIVAEADTKKSEAERHKYLQSELALKRLFGVIVTDMNKIRLQLYKRERIREQSRYLKYEEAVGSTGQSQGIYIQFLVSVINYISGMYAMQDSENRTKTIFIDNPFGAAKDIYIWEPIFELLKTNHVQLIVPSRGATPEITGRFDVNYVLGQQMAGGKALTVVTQYSSRTSEEAVEYHALEYEQATFDFI